MILLKLMDGKNQQNKSNYIMKFLKILIGIILILVIIFFARGLMTPSISYQSEITVDKSIEEAWAVMNDESKISEWLQDITKVEHISGTKGEVGAVTQYTFNQNGQESLVLETLKKTVPNKHVAMDFHMEGAMDMAYAVDFFEKDGKTHIKSSTTNTGQGLIMKSMFSFMQGSFQKQEDINMVNLKKLINENTTNYFPEPVPEIDVKEDMSQ